MTGTLNARLRSKDKLVLMTGIISLLAWQFGIAGRVYADTSVQTKDTPTLEIKLQNNQSISASNESLAYDQAFTEAQQAEQVAAITEQVASVRSYLQSKDSPLANYTEILLAQPDWKTIIAISNSESTLGKHCYVNNCSGIFAGNGLKTYENIPDWIVDMQNLLQTRYSGWTLNQMDGVYVYPRSSSWLMASSSVYKDLSNIQAQFPVQTIQQS
jgi:hypothetical protein